MSIEIDQHQLVDSPDPFREDSVRSSLTHSLKNDKEGSASESLTEEAVEDDHESKTLSVDQINNAHF